jgi:exopolysaccharide biosynthesis predicted pyruvyltransferase EpsI
MASCSYPRIAAFRVIVLEAFLLIRKKKVSISPVLEKLRSTTASALCDVLEGERNVAVLDFPGHMNVGDSMIWAGEMAYLRSADVSIRYMTDIERFNAATLRRRHPDGPILLHGGGNLGDVWPRFQSFREHVVSTFPDRKIVQLPQTLYFGSDERAAQANKVFGKHHDLTLLLRDHNSMRRSQEHLPSVKTRFVPDMALGWTPPVEGGHAKRGILLLARRDAESKGNVAGLQQGLAELAPVESADWGLTGPLLARWKATRIPGRVVRRFAGLHEWDATTTALHQAYKSMLRMNLNAGTSLFEGRSLIVTDRLHAHVLAALMGIPHVVLDNSYGKVGSIFNDYTGEFESAHFARDHDEALDLSRHILEGKKQ